jgi:hypothetical protein
MKREHGLLVSVYVYGSEQRPLGSWFRPPPGLPRPVAKGQNGSCERPQYGPSPRELREFQEGALRPLGGGRRMLRHRLHTAAPVNACNVYLVRPHTLKKGLVMMQFCNAIDLASIKDMTLSCLENPI